MFFFVAFSRHVSHLYFQLFLLLQRILCQRFKSRCSKKDSSENESSVRSGTSELPPVSLIKNSCASIKSATVDANKLTVQATDKVHKSDSDEGDFEIISTEQLAEMADIANGTENATEGTERQREDAEAKDQFPQQIKNDRSNWNMMELGEKRKRLR